MFTVYFLKKNLQEDQIISGSQGKYIVYKLGRFSAFGGNNFSLLEFSVFTTRILSSTLYMFQVIFVMTSKEGQSCVYCCNPCSEMTSLFYRELWKASLFLHYFDVGGSFLATLLITSFQV